MTEIIRSAGDSGDGVCIERKQPSTALKQMPHYTTWGGTYLTENIGGTAGPGGSTYFTENISGTAGPGGTTFLTGYAEADGFMKIGDIRGEFSPSRKADGVSNQHAQFTTGGGGDSVHQQPGTEDPGPEAPGPGYRSNWDVICDIGTSIKQTSVADALTNYRPEGFSEVEIHFVNPNAGQKGFTWEAAADIWTNGGASTFHGSSVDSWIEKTFGNGDGEYLGGISQGIRAEAAGATYLTENVGANSGPGGSTLLTGYAEAVGLDSSIFDVVNKLGGSASPGGDDI